MPFHVDDATREHNRWAFARLVYSIQSLKRLGARALPKSPQREVTAAEAERLEKRIHGLARIMRSRALYDARVHSMQRRLAKIRWSLLLDAQIPIANTGIPADASLRERVDACHKQFMAMQHAGLGQAEKVRSLKQRFDFIFATDVVKITGLLRTRGGPSRQRMSFVRQLEAEISSIHHQLHSIVRESTRLASSGGLALV